MVGRGDLQKVEDRVMHSGVFLLRDAKGKKVLDE